MHQPARYLVCFIMVLFSLALVACESPPDSAEEVEAAQIEPIEGTDFNRLVLTELAAQRLDIQTRPVSEEEVEGATRTVVPYAAIIYDVNGDTWVYVNPEPLTYLREAVAVDFIDGDKAVLLDGPDAGSQVVTVGVAELYGADTGIGR